MSFEFRGSCLDSRCASVNHGQVREPATVPILRGRGTKLVPMQSCHIPYLYRWETDPSSLYLWAHRRYMLSEAEYTEDILSRVKRFYHLFFIVLNSKETPVGFVFSYDENFVDGFVFAGAYIDPAYRQVGIGAKAGLLFGDYLFAHYGAIRKVYCEVFEYNCQSFAALRKAGFQIEGAFRQHRFYRGKYYTLYRLATYREVFYARFERILKNLYLKS